MTEYSYQLARKIMQSANYRRGLITKAKGEVSKWTKIEMSYRENLQEAKADGARKMLDKVLEKLDERKKYFGELKFPESDLPEPLSVVRCKDCGAKIENCTCYL